MSTVTNVQRGAQGFALLRLSSVCFSEQGEALPGVPELRTRSLGWVLSAFHLCEQRTNRSLTMALWLNIRLRVVDPSADAFDAFLRLTQVAEPLNRILMTGS